MQESVVLSGIIGALILLTVALISSYIFRKIHFSYTIGLVVSGIFIEMIFNKVNAQGGHPFSISHDLIIYFLLPVLIFETSINIDVDLLVKNIKPILILAAPGLVLATVITGVTVGYFSQLSFAAAFLFGALISATDPVAVTSMFKVIGAPPRLAILVDGESILNDGTAIVMYQTVLAIVLSGAAINFQTVANGAVSFTVVFAGGFVVGAAVSFLLIKIGVLLEKSPIMYGALSLLIAYSSYLIADRVFHWSGVMAAMGAGIVASRYAKPNLRLGVRSFITRFWELLAFIANSFIFLIVGVFGRELLMGIKDHFILLKYIFIAIAAITVARLILIYVILPLTIGKKDEKIDMPYRHVLFWGGLRGAVALALSLSIPDTLPDKNLIICMTVGIVLFTLFVQGTTIKKLMDYLGIGEGTGGKEAEEPTGMESM